MTNSILIGEYIYATLTGCEELVEQVGSKIYPLIAENTTTFPFIIYTRDGVESITRTKDGYCEDEITFTINVVDTDYTNTLHIANCVRKTMEKMYVQNEDIAIYDTQMTSIAENFVENAYVQTITFKCKAN